MKRIFLVVCLLMLTLDVFANGSQEKKEQSSNPIMQFQGTSLNMIMEQNATTDAIEALIPQFEKMTGIDVVIEKAPYDDVIQKETLAFVSGRGAYDLVSAPYEYIGNMVTNNYIQSIKPYMEDDSLHLVDSFDSKDIIKELWNACGEWKGSLYGVPENLCIMFYGFRKDLFENAEEKINFKAKYGYDLAEPKDWKQYRDIAEFFTRKKGEKLAGTTLASDFYGVSMSGKRHQATVFEWMNYMWSFGGNFFDKDGNLVFDSPETVAALEYYVGLTQYAPPGVSSKTWDEQTTELQQGIVAQAIFFNDCAPSVEDPDSSVAVGKYGYGQIPAVAEPVAHFGGWGYYIPTDSKNPKAAWLFLQWFLSKDIQTTLAKQGFFPSLASVYKNPEMESIPYWKASQEAFEICSKRPRISEWNSMCEILALEISKAIAGNETPAEACTNVQLEFGKILKDVLPVTYQ